MSARSSSLRRWGTVAFHVAGTRRVPSACAIERHPVTSRTALGECLLLSRHGRLRWWLRWLFRQAEHCLALIGLGTLVYFGCFDLSRITSGSMAPTLCGENVETGDLVLTERCTYWFRRPRRWEVIAFRRSDGEQVMKRVVGLPGERVQMLRGGKILIDGQPEDLPPALSFLEYFPFGNVHSNKTAECGEGYYVLGDFSRDSDDSRFNGPVPSKQLVGRPWLILAPAARRGFVQK
jgi:signal peptidase I